VVFICYLQITINGMSEEVKALTLKEKTITFLRNCFSKKNTL
jgi:hypothetical protein